MKNSWSYGEWKIRLQMYIGRNIDTPMEMEYIAGLYHTGIDPYGAYRWWKITQEGPKHAS